MNPIVKVSVRYGVIAGIVGSMLMIALFYLDRHPFLIPLYFDFRIILFVLFIVFALREIRDYHQNGVLYFWQGMIATFLLTLCYALVAAGILLVFINLVPAFLDEYVRLQTEQLQSLSPEIIESIGEDVYRRNLELLPSTTAAQLSQIHVLQSFAISLFISVILSVILRREPKP